MKNSHLQLQSAASSTRNAIRQRCFVNATQMQTVKLHGCRQRTNETAPAHCSDYKCRHLFDVCRRTASIIQQQVLALSQWSTATAVHLPSSVILSVEFEFQLYSPLTADKPRDFCIKANSPLVNRLINGTLLDAQPQIKQTLRA